MKITTNEAIHCVRSRSSYANGNGNLAFIYTVDFGSDFSDSRPPQLVVGELSS